MKPAQIARLDAATPRWPVARVSLAAAPMIELGGISTAIDGADPYAAAHEQVVGEARRRGHDLRMEVRNSDASVDRFIVRTDGTLIALDHARPRQSSPPPAPRAAGAAPAASLAPRAAAADRRRRILTWAAAVMGVLVVASIVVLIVNPQDSGSAPAQPSPAAPVPPAARLYTQAPPPGWSTDAAWALPVAKNTPVAVDADTGTIAALTPDDRSSTERAADTAGDVQARKPRYLSVLEADGSTRFALELDSTPSAGPAITTIDDEPVVAVVTGTRISYWPLDGPADAQVDVEVPAASAAAIDLDAHGVLIEATDTTLATIQNGAVRQFDALPLSTPITMTPGGALSVEDTSASWWLTGPGADPVEVDPSPPTGATAWSSTICADAEHVIVLWASDAPSEAAYKKPGILTAYATDTGELIAQSPVDSLAENKTAACAASPQSGLMAGNGFVLRDAGAQSGLTLVPGLHTDTVQDAVYGTISGDPVHIGIDGTITAQPDSALVPVAAGEDHLYVVSQSQLYALEPQ